MNTNFELTNFIFKNFNKDKRFLKIMKIMKENHFENYLFEDKMLPSSPIGKSPWAKIRNIINNVSKWANSSLVHPNIDIYYKLLNSKIEGGVKTFIIEKFSKKLGPYPFGIRGSVEYHKKNDKHISRYFLALKWFLNEDTKKHYTKELLDEMEEYENYLEEVGPKKIEWMNKHGDKLRRIKFD